MSEQSNVSLPIPTEKLIEQKNIKGTPFQVTTLADNGSFVSINNIKLSNTFTTQEEALQHYKDNRATIIVVACTTITTLQIEEHFKQALKEFDEAFGKPNFENIKTETT